MAMKKLCCAIALALALAGQVQANDGFSSEGSHAAGGALLAGLITRTFDESEHRALIGFGISTALVVVVEGSQLGTGARRRSQLLDISYHTFGSAVGSWVTDRFILSPVVAPGSVGLAYLQVF